MHRLIVLSAIIVFTSHAMDNQTFESTGTFSCFAGLLSCADRPNEEPTTNKVVHNNSNVHWTELINNTEQPEIKPKVDKKIEENEVSKWVMKNTMRR